MEPQSGAAASCVPGSRPTLARALLTGTAAAVLLFGCAPSILLTPNPRLPKSPSSMGEERRKSTVDSLLLAHEPPPPSPRQPVPARDTIREEAIAPGDSELDFSLAFAEPDSAAPSPKAPPVPETTVAPQPPRSPRILKVPSLSIRVALAKGLTRVSLYCVGEVAIGAPGLPKRLPASGRIVVEGADARSSIRLDAGPNRSRMFALPCSLLSVDGSSFIEVDERSYRGSIILLPHSEGRFTLVNYLNIEDYLGGVVDLEIGARPPEEIEAVKAQAIAARTYAFKRMCDRARQDFDVLATVEDQVYGGVAAESRQSEAAVRQTRRLVVTYDDSLINAYYHSTCGGITANVHEVWDKPPQPYLRAIRDADSTGQDYCANSRYYRWTESWTPGQISAILARSHSIAGVNGSCAGAVDNLRIESRFECGRVRVCRIMTSQGSCTVGGDAVRFVLRRADKDRSILRSANFAEGTIDSRHIEIAGKGYGHGVGMCQMGAVGRARAGKTAEEILKAYYPGTEIVKIGVVE